MRIDEIRRDVVVGQIAGEHRMNNADREVFMQLEVKMRRIEPVRVSNGADLLSATHLLTFSHEDSIEMSVQRIRIFYLTVLHKSMANHDHVSPRPTEIPGKSDHTISDRVDGITEICAAPSLPDPILTEVAVRSKTARDAITIGIRFANRKIKTICQTSERRIGVGLCKRGNQCDYCRGEQLFAHVRCF